MMIVISPAKKLNFEDEAPTTETSTPCFLSKKTKNLANELRNLQSQDVKKLMKLSDNLAELNYDRFQSFTTRHTVKNSKQALFSFAGDTYTGIAADTFTQKDITYAQKKLRMLSGLYGLLKPLDLIQPYRLEMGTKYKFQEYKDLYQYWQDDITNVLNEELGKTDYLINLASNEYFKAVNTKKIKVPVITPTFKEKKNGEYKIISFNAKKARGMMAAYIIKNKLSKLDEIKNFNLDGYKFNKSLSSETIPVFTR